MQFRLKYSNTFVQNLYIFSLFFFYRFKMEILSMAVQLSMLLLNKNRTKSDWQLTLNL